MYVMENLILSPQSQNVITDYINKSCLVPYEKHLLNEMLEAVEQNNQAKLDWFNSFGKDLRHMTMNVYAYRKGLEFGFTEIGFDKNGWFIQPKFLEREDIILGNPDRFSEHSILYLGRGQNLIWTYTLDYNYGLAGGGSHISVYDKQFNSRQEALTAGLNDLKAKMTAVIGHTDTTNFKQSVILLTLNAIKQAQINSVQLALF
jgi:hypothetical protein